MSNDFMRDVMVVQFVGGSNDGRIQICDASEHTLLVPTIVRADSLVEETPFPTYVPSLNCDEYVCGQFRTLIAISGLTYRQLANPNVRGEFILANDGRETQFYIKGLSRNTDDNPKQRYQADMWLLNSSWNASDTR